MSALHELSDYPVLQTIVARRSQVPKQLDDRACLHMYTSHMPANGWCMMDERERAFAPSLGIQERQQKDNNEA